MNKKTKAKWVKALRSGKYQQGRGALKRTLLENNTTYEYCCLGVACDINIATPYSDYAPAKNIFYGSNVNNTFLSIIIQDKLITFNDIKRKSFKWIAYYIERYL